MGKIVWPSEEDKFEAIGYLAKPGVIDVIEATVPADKLKKFQNEYRNKYSIEFPYITKAGSKYGYQFRIYLNDTEGCPEFLATQLDEKYKNRINDTSFIAELVNEYGFVFTKKQQDEKIIRNCVLSKAKEYIKSFQKGFRVYSDFLYDLSCKMNENDLPQPYIVQPKVASKTKGRKVKNSGEMKSSLTREQLFKLGWLGETYIYKMLVAKDESLLNLLGVSSTDNYKIEWFNEGVHRDEEWEDKSVGHGCDIIILSDNKELYIEVKASKRKNGIFTMTSNEMQKMRDEAGKYFLVKIDYLERLLKGESPEVMVFASPYNTFFKPEKMKEATFKIEGDANE
ncbi:MAG: DUF3883 domain-containing protein [Lachnospiraceae bacterium]|nr:DUF3883 domain-containing protein [Lachnospiraceae bacterium]